MCVFVKKKRFDVREAQQTSKPHYNYSYVWGGVRIYTCTATYVLIVCYVQYEQQHTATTKRKVAFRVNFRIPGISMLEWD